MEKNIEKKSLKKDIKYLKASSFEIKYRIYTEALELFLRCIVTFGFNNPYTKECFNVIKEMRQVLKEEKRLLTMLDNNIDHIRLDDLDEMIDTIDLGYDTYIGYSDILDNIYFACQEKNKERIVRNNKPIDSVVTNDEYKENVYTLIKKGTLKK